MASTYSQNLRIQLIATGEQAGVWGETTNTNFGSILDFAIAGLAIVAATNTAQALSANNGTFDQSRCACVQITAGTATGAFTIYIPPNSKTYVVYNSASYDATFRNSTANNGTTPTAGTTVTIPAGKTMIIFSDGTNVREQVTYLNAAGPTAAEKTNTTQLASTAFVDRLRSFGTSAKTSGTLDITDRGCLIVATATITIPANVFAANDVVTILNTYPSGSIAIDDGLGLTSFYLAGSNVNGGYIQMDPNAVATVIFKSPTSCVVTGVGLTKVP